MGLVVHGGEEGKGKMPRISFGTQRSEGKNRFVYGTIVVGTGFDAKWKGFPTQ
jgi:hypothetical protein